VRRLVTALTALLIFAALAPAVVRADGDPASDVLLGENVFYPYTPPTSASLSTMLNAETAAAVKNHFPIKVALIASPVDLGVIPSLFGMPEQYSIYLDQEISFQGKQPLLVVMYNGFGSQGLPAPSQAALASLPKPAGKQSNDLARAAITAVAKLAAADGHPLQGSGVPRPGGGSGGGNSTAAILLAILSVAALAIAAALVIVRRRQASM
jgi:hypothetical protein